MTADDRLPSPTLEELQRAETVLHACGLRFDGYRYAESRTSQDASDWLVDQRTTFARTLSLPDVPEVALATLFWVTIYLTHHHRTIGGFKLA